MPIVQRNRRSTPREDQRSSTRRAVVVGLLVLGVGALPFTGGALVADTPDDSPFPYEGGLVDPTTAFPDEIPVYGANGEVLEWIDRDDYFRELREMPVVGPEDGIAQIPADGPDEVWVEGDEALDDESDLEPRE